jgi:putative FmdB family regulatory protein
MPTYDYRCNDCNYSFEYFQSMVDKKLTKCPKCNGTLKRLIGPGSGPIFKGSGFYETDYKRPSSSAAKGASNTK